MVAFVGPGLSLRVRRSKCCLGGPYTDPWEVPVPPPSIASAARSPAESTSTADVPALGLVDGPQTPEGETVRGTPEDEA